jgi:transposase-like protein
MGVGLDCLVRVLAVKLCCGGLFLRKVSEILRDIGFRASYADVRNWFLKAGGFLPLTVRCWRGYVAVDETVIHSLARRTYLWTAREIRTWEAIAVQVSRGRGIGKCTKSSCINKPILYTDRGPWYDWPTKILEFKRGGEKHSGGETRQNHGSAS